MDIAADSVHACQFSDAEIQGGIFMNIKRFVILIFFVSLHSVLGQAQEAKPLKMTISTNPVVRKNVAILNAISINSAPIDLSNSFTLRNQKSEKTKRTFPHYFNGKPGSVTLDLEFESGTVDANKIFLQAYSEFFRTFDRMRNNKFVFLGNLPGELELTQDEIKWLKLNFTNHLFASNQLIDYSGETYSVEEVTSAKIVSTSSQWDPGEKRDYREVPEQAFKGIVFSVKLNKPISTDVRFSFFKEQPLWLVDGGLFFKRPAPNPERITDAKAIADIKTGLKKSWGKLEVNDRISFYLLEANSHSKIYSISGVTSECKVGWPNWSGCRANAEPHAKWVYFGIDVLNHDSIVNLDGQSSMGFSYQNDPQMKFYLLGDLNQNAANEFLYFTDTQVEGGNSATIYEIQNGQAYPVWNWSDFEE